MANGLIRMAGPSGSAVIDPGMQFIITAMVSLTAGTVFLMWIGEQITARGIGNGISLIIFAGIVARLPTAIEQMLTQLWTGSISGVFVLVVFVMVVVVIAGIVFFERAQRRLIVQYPKRQMGNKMFGGESSHLPLKLNSSGVIPPIFASSLLLLPLTVAGFYGSSAGAPVWLQDVMTYLGHGKAALHRALLRADRVLRLLLHRDRLQSGRHRGEPEEVQRLHPGHPSRQEHRRISRLRADPADRARRRLSLRRLRAAGNSDRQLRDPVYFGGTSLLIVVSVTMDTVAQIHSHLLAHQYEGLIKKAKLRGRR